MIRPRWQKVLSDIWRNKSRSLLVTASIAVGLFAIGIITKTYLTISQDMRQGFQATSPAHIQVRTSLIDWDMVELVANQKGVSRVEPQRKSSFQVRLASGDLVAIDIQTKDYADSKLNQVEVLEGSWPPNERQIVLADHKLDDLDTSVGEWLTLENTQGDSFQLQVVGIVKDQMIGTTSGSGGFFNASAQGYVTEKTIEWLGVEYPSLYNQLFIAIDSDPTIENNRTMVAARVRQALEERGVTIASLSTRSPTHHPNLELVDAILIVLLLLGFLIVFLSGFLITNTLQSLLAQQIQQIGIMKTVGAKRTQIITVYMSLILVFGLLAFAIAVPFANLATDNLMKSLASKINFHYSGARFEPIALAVQAILALIVPQVAGFIPILQGTRISVREALSGTRQTDAPDKSWIDRRLTRIRRLSRPFTISLRNVFRNKGRLILTLITLSLGGAVFISVFNVRVSLSNYMEQLSKYFLADLNLTMTRNYRVEEIEQTLGAIHEVASVEAWGLARSSVILEDGSLSEDLNLIAVPGDSTLIDPILLSGRWLLPQDENAIVLNDQFLAKFPDLHIGDTLKLQVNDQETEWVVVGYFQLAGKIGGLAAYVNLDYLVTLPGQIQPKHASSFRVVAHGSHDSADQKALAKEVEGMLAANSFQISAISTGNSMNESSSAGFAILTNLLLILAILTAMVGSIGLTGTMSMNVMDRTREIGVMRSIGASDPLLMRMVMMEGLVIGWISWLIGALLSFPISQLMSDMVTNALFGAPSTFGFTTTGFIIWFAVVSILSIGASFLPARNAARLTIREVLAYE